MDPYPSRIDLDLAIGEPCPAWRMHLPKLDEMCRTTAIAALSAAAPHLAAAELSLLLADADAVRILNRDWRGRDEPTNVLSFPSGAAPSVAGGPPMLLGDVALAFETVAAEAEDQGKALSDHFRHLLVHGILHLLGHDHEEDREAERMEALEAAILARLGVADPYAVEASHGR